MLGTVVPGFEVKVCDDDGNEVPSGEVGLLRVRGDSLALEYWQQADKTREAFQGEWFLSSDMVSRSEDGVFTYAGRSDDMLKVSGKWLSPKEVENCLLKHPAVGDCAVVGVVGADGLTKPHAFIVREESAAGQPGDALASELQLYVKATLAPYKYPREIHFMDELPRTHLGKVDRGELRRPRGPLESLGCWLPGHTFRETPAPPIDCRNLAFATRSRGASGAQADSCTHWTRRERWLPSSLPWPLWPGGSPCS